MNNSNNVSSAETSCSAMPCHCTVSMSILQSAIGLSSFQYLGSVSSDNARPVQSVPPLPAACRHCVRAVVAGNKALCTECDLYQNFHCGGLCPEIPEIAKPRRHPSSASQYAFIALCQQTSRSIQSTRWGQLNCKSFCLCVVY